MRHGDIIGRLSLVEKCALLQGATTFGTLAIERAGIPSVEFSDGPSGVRHQAGPADHLGLNGSEPATCFPTAVTVADTWDPALAERMAAAMGQEAAAQGVSTLLGPGLCIKRNPLCGRNFEYFSEDPYLAGKMAAAYVRGIQSNGIGACPKHFAVNSQETRRQASDSVVDERTLREIYLRAFEICVRESSPKAVMSSYNLVNGTYANESAHLLGEVLRDEWGFEGAVVTDWGGSNDHVAGVLAGSTIEMPAPGLSSVRELMAAVADGRLSEAELDARVDEAIDLALTTHAAVEGATHELDVEGHHRLAREVAAQGCVLLKNEGGLLPLAPATRVALVGDFAREPRYQGAGSSAVNCTRVDALLDVIGEKDLELVGYEQGFERHGGADATLLEAAVGLAGEADVVLLALALDEVAESEGADRRTMALNRNQVDALHAIAAANPNVVVLLSAGSAVESQWMADAPSVLYCALGGQAGAGAALDVVCGDVCPSGHLAESWPVRYEDVACADDFPSDERAAQYREGPFVGYRYYRSAGVGVAFPFGHGLSYTSFEYSDLVADAGSVELTVTNVGDRAGAEVVQAYASKPDPVVFRPEEELVGFEKVWLEPGEGRRVRIDLDDRALSHFDVSTGRWEVEGGTWELRVGSSSEDLRLCARIEVEGTTHADPYAGRDVSRYRAADVRHVDDASFEALLGRPLPDEGPRIGRNMCFRDLNHGRSPLFWLVWLVLRQMLRASERRGTPDLNVLFVWNMPLRALAKMTNGVVNMRMVDSLVMEVRGLWLVGLLRFLVELVANLVANAVVGRRLAAATRA